MPTEKRRIAEAAGVVSALTLMSRVTGLIRDIVISYLFGAGTAAEAFFVAFRFPNLFRRLVAEGAMAVAFVPVFSDLLSNRPRAEAVRGLRALIGVAALVLAVMALAGSIFSPLWIDAVAPGFAGEPELRSLAITLTRWLFPYLFFIGLVAVMAGYLNASRHFIAPALSPALLNLSVISAALLLSGFLAVPVRALAIGVLVGGLGQLALQVAALVRRGAVPLPTWEPRHEAVRRAARLLLPATIGTAIFQINVLIGTMLASLLAVGSVSYLWYADRVFEFPLGLVVSALGTAALPSMASQASRRQYAELGDSLGFALSLMNLVAIPASIGLVLLAQPITAVLFERGAFGADETAATASALQFYAIGLWSVAATRLLAPAFYALGEPRTPVRVAALAVVVNVLASVVLMGPVDDDKSPAWLVAAINSLSIADLDHAGLALATSIAGTVNALVLAAGLAARLPGHFDWRGTLGSIARSLAAALPMGVAVYAASQLFQPWFAASLAWRIGALTAVIAVGISVFAAGCLVIGGPDVERAKRYLRNRGR